MSWTADVKKGLALSSMALHGLEKIASITNFKGTSSDAALHAISTIVDVLKDGFDGTKDPINVEDEISKLHGSLAMNDAAAQSALDKKFPTG